MCENYQLSWTHSKRRLEYSHPLFEEGNILCCMLAKQLPFDLAADEEFLDDSESNGIPCGISGCNKILDSLTSYELHYNSTHRNACSQCKRNFPTSHLLDIHLLEWHDSMFDLLASKSPMYQCLLELCGDKFWNSKDRKNHMIKCHKFPSNYRFEREKRQKTESKDGESMEVNTSREEVSQNRRVFSYKVPNQICFGQGSALGFQRGRGRGNKGPKKHWHQTKKGKNTAVDIESVDMKELAQVLEAPKDGAMEN